MNTRVTAQAAIEQIHQAAAEAVATEHYMIGIFYEKDGKLVCWSKFDAFPERGVDQSLEHLRRRAQSRNKILTGCFLPDDEEIRKLHVASPEARP